MPERWAIGLVQPELLLAKYLFTVAATHTWLCDTFHQISSPQKLQDCPSRFLAAFSRVVGRYHPWWFRVLFSELGPQK